MRIFLTLGVASLLSLAQASAAQALPAKKNQQLPPKKANFNQKLSHCSSSSSSSSRPLSIFDAAYTQGDQSGFIVGVPTPISFAINQIGSPQNIFHPVLSDTTKFEVIHTGAYLIGWTLNLRNLAQPDQVTIQLFDFSTSTVIGPDPFQIVNTGVIVPDTDSVSGQTIVRLDRNTVLQLLITDPAGGLVVTNPTFFIVKVGD